MQVAPVAKPVTVVTNGVASLAEPELGEGVPLVHVTLTRTLAPLFGTKSLFTVNVPLFSVFTMVQLPLPEGAPVIAPLHVPVDVYPLGTVSVAVHVAPALYPVTVVVNGVASDALPEDGLGVPLVQVMLTETDPPAFGTKSLFTVKVAVFSVFVIVHAPTDTAALHVPDEL